MLENHQDLKDSILKQSESDDKSGRDKKIENLQTSVSEVKKMLKELKLTEKEAEQSKVEMRQFDWKTQNSEMVEFLKSNKLTVMFYPRENNSRDAEILNNLERLAPGVKSYAQFAKIKGFINPSGHTAFYKNR